MIQLLSWDFKTGELLDTLESFDNACQKYAETWKKEIDDDIKIGVVIKGMETGPLREHMLLHSERCETYEEFRDEVDTIAKARSANLLTATPMDLGAFGKGGKKGKGKGKSSKGNWGKGGYAQADSWSDNRGGGKGFGKGAVKGKGKGKGKGAESRSASQMSRKSNGSQSGKECYKCGGVGHFAKDCRSSEFKIRKYQEEKRQRAQEFQEEDLPEYNDKSGFGFMCQLCEDAGFLGQINEVRRYRSNRLLKLRVDSDATVTVVPKNHPATRG